MGKIDFLNCAEFKLIKKLMGISDNDKTSFTIEISADDPNLEISSEGITYKGRRVILYIRDQVQYGDKKSEYKFHLIDCATLKAMRNQNRYDKYVVSHETTGKFKVNRIVNNRATKIEVELHVCKHCLQRLKRQGYNFDYTCQECGKNFSGCKSRLHVHHKNGLKNDCRESNLEVLCADCHQAKHSHKIMRK